MRNDRRVSAALHKLANTAGETMVETLVSILISALALLLLSTAVGTAVHMVVSNRDYTEEYFEEGNTMVNNAASAFPTRSESIRVSVPLESGATGYSDIQVEVYEGSDGVAFYERNTP